MFMRTEEEVAPRSGSKRHIHFVGFFNVPVQATTRGHQYGYSEKPPDLVACYDTLGCGEHILDLPPGPNRGTLPIELKRL